MDGKNARPGGQVSGLESCFSYYRKAQTHLRFPDHSIPAHLSSGLWYHCDPSL